MNLIKDYMRDDARRHELNDLTRATFGFDFEGWVTDGYFEGDYIPYSLEEDGRLLSNVSANIMDFDIGGERKRYIQLGTVMTAEDQRKKGYAAQLVREVLSDFDGRVDGFYLFANLEALGFYEKQGFKRVNEYRYALKQPVPRDPALKPFVPAEPSDAAAYQSAVRHAAANAALDQTNRFGLQMFYTAELDGVYRCDEPDCWIVLENDGNDLSLQSVICPRPVSLSDILPRLPIPYERLTLGFVPRKEDAALFDAELYDGADDYRLYYIGRDVERIEREKLYFPAMSHA